MLITVNSHPLLRAWGYVAAVVAALLLLRGAWLAAIALFVLSPAPVMMFTPAGPDRGRLALSWLGSVAIAFIVIVGLFAVVVGMGGIPPVHEWVKR